MFWRQRLFSCHISDMMWIIPIFIREWGSCSSTSVSCLVLAMDWVLSLWYWSCAWFASRHTGTGQPCSACNCFQIYEYARIEDMFLNIWICEDWRYEKLNMWWEVQGVRLTHLQERPTVASLLFSFSFFTRGGNMRGQYWGCLTVTSGTLQNDYINTILNRINH